MQQAKQRQKLAGLQAELERMRAEEEKFLAEAALNGDVVLEGGSGSDDEARSLLLVLIHHPHISPIQSAIEA